LSVFYFAKCKVGRTKRKISFLSCFHLHNEGAFPYTNYWLIASLADRLEMV
jgi:hypothetical protein